jgi:glycosyltransferase involved in cell wall biosynthesis
MAKLFPTSSSAVVSAGVLRLKCLAKYIYILPMVDSIYLTLSGGKGQIFDFFVALIAAVLNKPLICHHHSYKYIVQESILVKLMALVGSFNTTHIFLGESMRDQFVSRYGSVKSICISNLAFMPPVDTNSLSKVADNHVGSNPIVISHLSNLSLDKGSHHFIELAKLSQLRNQPWKFLLAGPMTDEIKLVYHSALKSLANLDYLGPLDEVGKDFFYKASTFFVFLSEYKNEAEPLVLLEAISKGVVPISTKLGEIPSLIPIDKLLTDRCDLHVAAYGLILDAINNNNHFEYATTLASVLQCRQEMSVSEKSHLLKLLNSL